MKILIEVTKEEMTECGFVNEENMRESIISDLDDARDYPGFNIKVIVTDE